MFTNVIYLVLVLLLVSFAPMGNVSPWVPSPQAAFASGMALYGMLLALIALQNKIFRSALKRYKGALLAAANFGLLAFLAVYHFFLAGQRLFPNSLFLVSLFSLLLYFLGLFIFHFTAYPALPTKVHSRMHSAADYSLAQTMLVAPLAIPFLLFSLIVDLAQLLPNKKLANILTRGGETLAETAALAAITLSAMVLVLIFFPPLLQAIWRCKPLPEGELKSRLEAICRRARFKNAGIKTWTLMNHSFTAGIIGILPHYRYVMFTQRLLDEMDTEALEAVLAHEIGHSAHRHLLVYPVILFGMIVASGLFSLFFGEAIETFFELRMQHTPSLLWYALFPFTIFAIVGLIFYAYFRIVFGYFSRLFERQADLHVFALGLSAESMQRALDDLGTLTGGSHHFPSWHHHSLWERINFLDQAKANPEVISKHHRRVRNSLILYLLVLVPALIVLISPTIPQYPPFREIAEWIQAASKAISESVNGAFS